MKSINSENLLRELKNLMNLSKQHNSEASSTVKKIDELILDAQSKLTDVQGRKIDAMLSGNDTHNLDIEEEKLLSQISLLKVKKENAFNSNSSVIARKLIALVPLIPDAEKEEKEFKQDKANKIKEIDLKIKELKEQRMKVSYEEHPYRQCYGYIGDIEKISLLEKGTINGLILKAKGLDVVKNPYFGGEN